MLSCVCPDALVQGTPPLWHQVANGVAAALFVLVWVSALSIHVDWKSTTGRVFAGRQQLLTGCGASNPEIAQRLARRRAERFADVVRSSLLYVTPVMIAIIFFSAFNGIQKDIYVRTAKAGQTLFSFVMFLLLSAVPAMKRKSVLDVVFSLVYLATAVPPVLAPDPFSHLWYFGIMTVELLYCSFIYPDFRMAVILNPIWFTGHLAFALVTPELEPHRIGNILMMIMVLSFCLVTSLNTYSMMRVTTEAKLSEQEAKDASRNVESLLNVMCEAVVIVKQDMTLLQPSKALESMLFRNSGLGGSIGGRRFTHFLSPDDVERFETFFGSSAADCATSIHVDLVDSLGHRVPVQVFHTCTRDHDQQTEKHLLGLVEDVDIELRDPEAFSPQSASPVANGERRPKAAPSRTSGSRAGSEDELNSVASAPSSIGAISAWSATTEGAEASLVLRTWLSWEVVSESRSSRIYFGFGKEPDTLLRRFRRPVAVARWLEYIHTMAVNGGRNHPRLQFGKVAVRGASSANLEYRALMRAKILQAPEPLPVNPESPSSFDGNDYGHYEDPDGKRCVEIELKFKPPSLRSPSPSKAPAAAPAASSEEVGRPCQPTG